MPKRGTNRPDGRARLFLKGAAILTVALLAFAGAAGLGSFLGIHPASAATAASDIADATNQTGTAIGLASTDLPTYIGRIISYVLGLLGVIALVLFIYAGYLFMTAAGAEEKTTKAKKLMVDAIIGMVIILAAYSIATFILNMILGAAGLGSGETSATTAPLYSSSRGRSAVGNGLLDYHYPEAGQTDVARNTKVSVTFKRPLVLSTVLQGYDDKGTFTTADDTVLRNGSQVAVASLPFDQRTYDLKPDAIRLFAQENLGTAAGATVDAQFDALYPVAKMVTGFKVRVTDTPVAYDPLTEQTITFKPNVYLGSASVAMNYRVTLRGGDTGVKVWNKPAKVGEVPPQTPAFPLAYANGGYYWNFTTGTVLDLTPPQLSYTYPSVTADPTGAPVYRNQLLQAYFDEAMDPTTASGNAARGYTQMGVEAATTAGSYAPVPGEFFVGNRYRTVEFVPSGPCDTAGGSVSVNSCGDTVTCLPANADLRVYGLAASVSVSDLASRPAASADNGLEDMAGNSFDGNRDGQAQGPEQSAVTQPDGRSGRYDLNTAFNTPLTAVSDTAQWRYRVNDDIDLTPPMVTAIDPPPTSADYPAGRNRIPPELAPSFIWSKVMSISSIRTGGYDETANNFTDDDSTLVLRAKEMEKRAGSPACPGTADEPCRTNRLDPPSFYAEMELATAPTPHSRIYLRHPDRTFYKGSDLGFTSDEIQSGYDSAIPMYVPIARARLRDTLQNCFYPSYYKPTPTAEECENGTADQTSCCDIYAKSDANFRAQCSP